ncbi:MAG: tail fiber domain-containing protein [Bacteroidales bacterium]
MKKIVVVIFVVLFTINAYAQFKLANNGNIGIGTLTPSERLEINGGNLLQNDSKDIILRAGLYPNHSNPGDIVFQGSIGDEYARIFSFPNTLRFRANIDPRNEGDISILSNGNVGIGTIAPNERLEIKGGNLLVNESNNLILRAKSTDPGDVIFQDSQQDEYARIFTFKDALRIRTTDAIYGDFSILKSNGNIGIGVISAWSYKLEVAGDILCERLYELSDERFKKDIKPIENSRNIIDKLNGVSYFFSKTDLSNNNSNSEKTQNRNIDSKRQFGFIEQDLKNALPDLVKKDSSGFYSVDYISMIPLLVEAMKEQSNVVDAQSLKIKELGNNLIRLENIMNADIKDGTKYTKGTNNLSLPVNTTNAFLYQNTPNPFSEKTEIRYFLPESVLESSLYIFDMQGTLLKTIPIKTQGQGSVTIRGTELKAGMYIYTLISDGTEIDSKRMILTP